MDKEENMRVVIIFSLLVSIFTGNHAVLQYTYTTVSSAGVIQPSRPLQSSPVYTSIEHHKLCSQLFAEKNS